jgi:hypothetical protein
MYRAILTITPEDCKSWFEACFYYWEDSSIILLDCL